MFKCPKCDAWMQWRYNYGQSYWICNQCGYSPETYPSNKTEVKEVGALADLWNKAQRKNT